MFELIENVPSNAVIKVIGVGGGGGNAVKHMIANNVEGVDFICANTDAQALSDIESKTVLQLGGDITKGLGAGANPEIGRAAAMEDRERIADALKGADMVFITAGMGGGTGTGGAPVVAEVARELGILTVAVVTRPFPFEGKKRLQYCRRGGAELQQHVDSLITIPNEKLLEVLGKNTSLLDAFKEANDVLLGAVQGIADLIIRPGMINVDFRRRTHCHVRNGHGDDGYRPARREKIAHARRRKEQSTARCWTILTWRERAAFWSISLLVSIFLWESFPRLATRSRNLRRKMLPLLSAL